MQHDHVPKSAASDLPVMSGKRDGMRKRDRQRGIEVFQWNNSQPAVHCLLVFVSDIYINCSLTMRFHFFSNNNAMAKMSVFSFNL